MSQRKKWCIIWTTWLGYFAIAETAAVRSRHPDAPLSAHCRYVLRTKDDNRTQRILGQIALGAATVWFIRHIYGEVDQ
jgi:hypothetical protein